jgi:hypothetical protein
MAKVGVAIRRANMNKQTEFIGGPFGGLKSPLAGMAEVVAVSVDTSLGKPSKDEPFAFALYRRRADDLGVKYHFVCFERPNKQPFEAEFADGPNQGTHPFPQPPHYCMKEVLIPLTGERQVFKGDGEPSAVAIYRSRLAEGRWQFCLDRIEESGENVDEARLQINERRTIQAMNHFYQSPDYSVYRKPPTDEHPQVFIEHGHRRACVDEKMASLIRAIWERGIETLGSCQERPSGKAYIGFPLARQGRLFHERLLEASIGSEYEANQSKFQNADTGHIISVDSANVSFATSDIPRIVALVNGSTPTSSAAST